MDFSSVRPLAVIFATKGGMGDVGKFAAVEAFTSVSVATRVIALAPQEENPDMDIDVDVEDERIRSELKSKFDSFTTVRINVDAEDAKAQLVSALKDVNGVIACIGSRQPKYTRWCKRGARLIKESMIDAEVDRIVALSSFGIGDDFTSFSFLKVCWGLMLNTNYRSVKKDLMEMESILADSKLDYLTVRAMGLTPSEQPTGGWKVLTGPNQGRLRLGIAKKDVAKFMVKEAREPTLHRSFVTIGQEK